MTTTLPAPTNPVVPGVAPGATAEPDAESVGLRRAVQVSLPAVAGALLAAAAFTDPGLSNEGREMVRVYADNLGLLQWHVLTLHLAYGVWGLVPVALAPLVRGRGRRLMNAGAVLGFLVMVSMPALMMSDIFSAAIANEHGLDAAMKLYDGIPAEQWSVMSYLVPGIIGMLVCLPLTFAALARARRTSWWAVVPAVLVMPAFGALYGVPGGVLVSTALLVGLSVLVARATRA
jgi:hypothetical protein